MPTIFAATLRRANRECSGHEPSISVLQMSADEAADLIDELSDELFFARAILFGEGFNVSSIDRVLAKTTGQER